MKKADLIKLEAPIPIKWRVQSKKGGKAICVPYIDSRDVQNILDDVCGKSDWQNTYDAETGTSSIGIYIDELKDWIWKSDVGTESKVEAKKGQASDALKRAGVVWGIGRNIYGIGSKLLDLKNNDPVTSKGKSLLTPEHITLYLNGLNESQGLLMQIWKKNPELQENEDFKNSLSKLKELCSKM